MFPGLFEPFEMKGLYPGVNVRLVDGAVFDNAGLQSLYHSAVDYILCNEMGSYLPDDWNPDAVKIKKMNMKIN